MYGYVDLKIIIIIIIIIIRNQLLALQVDPNRRDGWEMEDGRSNENEIGRSKAVQHIYILAVGLLCDLNNIFLVWKKAHSVGLELGVIRCEVEPEVDTEVHNIFMENALTRSERYKRKHAPG